MPPKFKKSVEMTDRRGASEPERQGLLDSQSDEDDFFLRGPSVQTNNLMKDSKVAKVQGQVDEVVGVMKTNITKVMERGDRLEDLQDKSDDLAFQADYFRSTARGLRTQMWWRECKMRLLLAIVIIVILVIIFVPIIVQHMK